MPAKPDEGALRKAVEQTQAKVDELRAKYQSKPTKQLGRQLLTAREKASEALVALYEAAPNEKPPTQRVM
jgi:hypothetical protein